MRTPMKTNVKLAVAVLGSTACILTGFAWGAKAASDIKLYVNGQMSTVPIELIQDTSYVPLRSVSEMLGAEVRWEDNTRSVFITSAHSNDYQDGVYQFGGLAVSDVSAANLDYGWSITADIRNTGGKDYRTVGLTAAFYDAGGKRLGVATGTVYELGISQTKTVIFATTDDLSGYASIKFQTDFTS